MTVSQPSAAPGAAPSGGTAEPAATPAPALELPPGTPTRVALVGAGFIAEFHLEILRALEEVEVVAVCDPVLARAEGLARRFGVQGVVDSIEALRPLGCHVAHVLAPPDRHAELTRRLLEMGLGVLVEKPLATDSATARELARLAARRGLPLAVNHNHAFQPAFQRLMQRVRAGEIGRVQHVQVTWSVPLAQLEARDYGHWMFRTPRNIVFEQGVHPLSQVQALIGRVIDAEGRILGTRELGPGQDFHDRWLLGGRGERGTAELYLAFDQGFTRNAITVLGSDGCLEADFAHDTLIGETKTRWLDAWDGFLADWRKHKQHGTEAIRSLADYATATLGWAPRKDAFFVGMRDSLKAFHAALRARAPLPADGERAAEVLEWCERLAAPASCVEAPRVELPEPGLARQGEVVVLGATGFIGRRVVAVLRARGLPVTLLVRDPARLPRELAEYVESGELRAIRGDLSDNVAIGKAIAGADCVVHLATGGGATWNELERSMVRGTGAVAQACLQAGVRRLLYVSSVAALYTGDDAGELLEDSTPTDREPLARAVYSRAKIETEGLLMRLSRERGLPVVILRPGVVVGEGTALQHSGLGHWARDNQCVGWGRRDHALPLVLVDDVAEAIVLAAQHPGDELDGKALNLAARVPITAREMVAALAQASGRALHYTPRSVELSYAMELGKYAVKRAGGRRDAERPSWRDLKARALAPAFSSRTARELLGWKPCEEREEFLARATAHLRRGAGK